MKVKIDFSGGLELMFECKRNIELEMNDIINNEDGTVTNK